ncbi:ankyrin repeat domain-containing protein 31-like [Scyliorhinus canicula]|uniref:ankyrin repeat domain-containing protein 31-like n=1 Tax=Scyliorhinus canicula TaxID=7830 RepID=UPI0018F29917|nr:ankyrin repeat domain-containing protein 31-like [Scyliorhinus canicula]
MELEAMSDCESEETIVEGSVQDSEGEEEELRVERMLFIHKNAFQLYHTMSDFTSGTEAVFGGNSSPVIQMIPKSKCFRLHVENRQQQVKTLAYDQTTQPEQSQYLLRSGVTHLAGTSSSGRISPPVTHIDVDHNYSRENSQDSDETMLDMNNDLPAETNEHIISDEENSPEINLLTGAVITPSTLTKAKRISPANELSATDCTTPDLSSVFSRHATTLGASKLPLAETLISKTLPTEAEAAVQPIWGSLTQRIMSPQGENLVARGSVEHKTNSQSRGSELLLVDSLRPLSSDSLTNSLTPMNMSPEIGSTVEPLAERRNALPVELTALNNMPSMVSITPAIEALPSANGKSAIDSSTQDTPGVKTGALTLHDNDTQDDDDLTQITHYEPSSQSPKKTEHLEQTSIEFLNKNETESETSKCEAMDKLAKGQILSTTDRSLITSAQEDNSTDSTARPKSGRKRIAKEVNCPCNEPPASSRQSFHFNEKSTDKKRKVMSPVREDFSDKPSECSGRKRIPRSRDSKTTFMNNVTPKATCNELSHNKKTTPFNNARDAKIGNSFIFQPLNHQMQSRQTLNHAQDSTNVRNRETVLLRKDDNEKERENTANGKTEKRQSASQHGTISATNPRQSSRVKKENSVHCHNQCQDTNHRNAAESGGEHILTRSTYSRSAIVRYRQNMNRRNIYGETKFHKAALSGNVHLLRALIQAGVNVNLPDYAGWTALHEASRKGYHDAVELLLSAGADIDCKGLNGVTPLQEAVINGHFEVVRLLMQHGANPLEKNEFGECALQEKTDIHMKRLIKNYQQKQTAAVKVGSQIIKGANLKNAMDNRTFEVCRISKTGALSGNFDTTLRKTERTHQTERTQNATVTVNVMENKSTFVDVGQPQRTITTRYMVKLQSQFGSHSEQQNMQSKPFKSAPQSADKDDIQTEAASVTMKTTKPTSCDFSSPTAVVTEASKTLRQSARIRNLTCGFIGQAGKISREPSHETSQQNIRALKPFAAASNSKMRATVNCQERIVGLAASQLTTPNPKTKLAGKSCTLNTLKSVSNKPTVNDTANGKLDANEVLNAGNNNEQSAQLKNHSQQPPAKTQASDDLMSIKGICNINVEMVPKIHETGNTIDHTTSLETRTSNLPDCVKSTEVSHSAEHRSNTEYSGTAELSMMGDEFQEGEIRQWESTKNKTVDEGSDGNVEGSVVLEHRCSYPVISEHESGQIPIAPVISASDSERLDNVTTEYALSSNVVPIGDCSVTTIEEPVTPWGKPKEVTIVTDHHCGPVSGYKLNAVTENWHSEPQTCMGKCDITTAGPIIDNVNAAGPLFTEINMETGKEVNVNEARDSFANNQCSVPAQDIIKNGTDQVVQIRSNNNKRNTLQMTEGMHSTYSAEVNTNKKIEEQRTKRSGRQRTIKLPGYQIPNIVRSWSDIPKLSPLNKKNGKGETRLHLAVMKGDLSSVRSLIAAGIHVNIKDNAGWTPLHEACSRGLTDVIQELLKADADVNSRGMNGVLPLHDAVNGSYYEVVKLLLQYGADPKLKSADGKNAFAELADDKIKDLLETHCNREVTVSEQPQPIIGWFCNGSSIMKCSSTDNRVSFDDKQTPPTLQNARGSGSPHYDISQHESIILTLNEVEMKQERMMKCKLKEPENAAQFELELSQVQTVLNEILTKHKAEKEDLVKKFGVSPASFRQGTLQKQVTALASRQRRFLNLLQKRRALDQKLQEYKLKLKQTQKDNSAKPTKNLTCIIKSCTRTDTRSNEAQVLSQGEGPSASSVNATSREAGLTCSSAEAECMQKHSLDKMGFAASQDTNRYGAVQENTAGCSNERAATICSDSSICAASPSKSVPSKGEANALQPHSLDTSHIQRETFNARQADNRDSTACSNSGQNDLLSTTQSTHNPENNLEITDDCTVLNTSVEKSNAIHKEVVNTNPIETSRNSQMLPKNTTEIFLVQPQAFQQKSSHQLIALPSTSQWGGNRQQTLQFNTVGSSGICQARLNAAHPNNQCTMQVNATQVTWNSEDNSLVGVSTPSGSQHDAESLPEDKGSGQRKLLHLIDLINHGLIQPGKDVLQVKLQGTCYKAELLASGLIRSKEGVIHRNLVHWIKVLLGDQIPVSRKFAWSKVTYRNKELSEYSSIIKSSFKPPDTQHISKPTRTTDQSSSMSPQCGISRESTPKSQNEKSSSNFMQLHEILLIRNEEFLPCHIMDQHWKFYTECDDWNFCSSS